MLTHDDLSETTQKIQEMVQAGDDEMIVHAPTNRALIHTGWYTPDDLRTLAALIETSSKLMNAELTVQ